MQISIEKGEPRVMNNRIPLYVQAKEYILKLIENGEYKPNHQLPSEKEMMEKLNVGRATVRAALAELEHEGIVVKQHGIGTFVNLSQKSFSFEPLISLSFSLKKIGINLQNKILAVEKIEAQGDLLSGWAQGAPLGHIKRIRMSGGATIAIEDSYYIPKLFDIIKNAGPSESVAHLILEGSTDNIGRVLMDVVMRDPTDEERYILNIDAGERVAHMRRWIYAQDNKKPVNYVSFVVPTKFLK